MPPTDDNRTDWKLVGAFMKIFVTLYNFAHNLLTAHPKSALGRLSAHSGKDSPTAHQVLRAAILQESMPGENMQTQWSVVRVFMRNLVNRAFAPTTSENMRQLLNTVEEQNPGAGFEELVATLMRAAHATDPRLAESLAALFNRKPVEGIDYVTWLRQRAAFYADQLIADVDSRQVIDDVRVISSNPSTRIPHIGVALAANLLADLGARALAKPDKHVQFVIGALVPGQRMTQEDCIRTVIELVRREAPEVQQNGEFSWLPSGLHPRHLDRLIYLIGSDNFLLDGTQRKCHAPARRQQMLAALQSERSDVVMPAGHADLVVARLMPEAEAHQEQVGAEVRFYQAIGEFDSAIEFIDQVRELCAEYGCEVHYTMTKGADLRIRAFRSGPSRHERNVVTMAWPKGGGYFNCAVLAPADVCLRFGLPPENVLPNPHDPLPTRVRVHPNDTGETVAFRRVLADSIARFTERC